ncbi:hypothetical protein [Actinacidiphila yeochonensis]|uniref:hypothetical protein n=1 Tax=Actinacidiphila yeochonensis TaxID=89050 RepID=UPI00055EDC36|nr:hypothetical protein [Actinacidiphila yeochonensis]
MTGASPRTRGAAPPWRHSRAHRLLAAAAAGLLAATVLILLSATAHAAGPSGPRLPSGSLRSGAPPAR